jgi:hypothetical protein
MNMDRIHKSTVVDANGCWVWQKSTCGAGYGQLTVNKKYWMAHRYSYAATNGTLSSSDVIRHICHNPKCCNPDHLLAGSHADNWKDSEQKHRDHHRKVATTWIVGDMSFSTSRQAVAQTGLSITTLIKYSTNGVFDISAYRAGCVKANVVPRV